MKHYIFLLLSLFLVACAEQDLSGDDPTAATAPGLRLSVRLSAGAATRALGDPFASGKEEKRIDRLAFFVHTAEDGFQVYPPVPDDVTDPDIAAKDHPNAVYLSGTPESGYEASVALTAGGGYMADIIAIANLPADYDYRQIVSWQGLCDTVAIHAAAMPACLPGSAESDKGKRNAFVMYGDIRKELKKEETNTLAFALSRLVARIDITNEAYETGTTPDNAATGPQNSFFLTSARLLHAQPAAYLVPKPDRTPSVVTTGNWRAITGIGTEILYGKPTNKTSAEDPTQEPEKVTVATTTDAENASLQYAWHTLYTYPNSDTEHAPTALEIKGTFRGTEITRQIPFVDKDGNAFPVEGNHRYLVRIIKAPGLTDIAYNITVSEWDAVDTVHVKPDQTEVPVIAKLESDGTYVEKTKQYDFYHTVDGEISFDATCNFAPDVRVRYEEPGQADWITIEKSEPELVTKATKLYKRHFKITVSKAADKVNRKALLLVHNGGSEVECDTINVRQTYYYPGTELEGIPVTDDNGNTTIWAPVNCGATRVATKIYDPSNKLTDEELKSNQEQQGNLYQWGRKVPFKVPNKGDKIDYVMYDTADEYAPYEKAVVPGYANDKLIATRYQMTNQYCWFRWYDMKDEKFSPTIKEAGYKWPSENDPCPNGWRVASKEDWTVVVDAMKSDVPDQENLIWKASLIKGSFVIPACPSISISFPTLSYNGLSICYRVSDYFSIDNNQYTIVFNSMGASILDTGIFYSTANPLRCVAK